MTLTAEILNLSDSDYHNHTFSKIPHYSNSIGKRILDKTPRHAWLDHPILNPNYEPEEDTSKFAIGTVAHAALLQGLDVCAPLDFKDYRTNAAKEARDQALAAGLIPMLQSQFEEVQIMVEAAKHQLAANSDIGNVTLDQGKAEQTIIMTKGEDNPKTMKLATRIKTRLDWLRDDGQLIIDYKTTDIASPDQWARKISDMGVDMQNALYKKVVEVLTGKPPRMVFAVQEVKPPYPMYFIELIGPYQEYGESRTNRALSVWERCIEQNQWPMYDQRIMAPDIPAYIEAQWLEKEAEIEFDIEKVGAGPVSKEAFLFGKVN